MNKFIIVLKQLGLSPSNWFKNLSINLLNKKVKKTRAFLFRCEPFTIVQLDEGAVLELNDYLYLGRKQVKASKMETRVLLEKNARLTVNGSFQCFAGSYIRVVQGGELILDGGFINENVQITAGAIVHIGKGATIGRDVVIRSYDGHYIDRPDYNVSEPITIGEHVWIGQGATILKGVTIGEGSVIASGAIVTKDVPPHCVAAGVPAKIVSENLKWNN